MVSSSDEESPHEEACEESHADAAAVGQRGLPSMWDTRCWAGGCPFAGSPERLRKCSRCRTARYCSQRCQRADWSVHRDRCEEVATLAAVARTVVHPRSILPLERAFDDAVWGYVVLGTGHGDRVGRLSWTFVKLSLPDRQRALLRQGVGLLRRGDWFDRGQEYEDALDAMWRLFYCDDGMLLRMVACEGLGARADSGEPLVVVRDQLRHVSRRRQRAITELASAVGMGVIFQYQPSSRPRLDVAGDDPSMTVIGEFVLTPALLRAAGASGLRTCRDRFVRFGLAPLLPAAR